MKKLKKILNGKDNRVKYKYNDHSYICKLFINIKNIKNNSVKNYMGTGFLAGECITTAAHCVTDNDIDNEIVSVKCVFNWENKNNRIIIIAHKICIFGNYKNSFAYDIAMIKPENIKFFEKMISANFYNTGVPTYVDDKLYFERIEYGSKKSIKIINEIKELKIIGYPGEKNDKFLYGHNGKCLGKKRKWFII